MAELIRSARSLSTNHCRLCLRKVRDSLSCIWPNIHPNFAALAYLRSGLRSFVVEMKWKLGIIRNVLSIIVKNVLKCFVTLKSVHDVMKAQKQLMSAGISINVVATPREISHNCGVVVQFACECIYRIETIICCEDHGNFGLFRKARKVWKRSSRLNTEIAD